MGNVITSKDTSTKVSLNPLDDYQYEYSALMVSYGSTGLPWLSNLRNSNPKCKIFTVCDNQGKKSNEWKHRNFDAVLVKWWKKNHSLVNTDHIWLLGHDVLATAPLPDCSEVLGMGGSIIRTLENSPGCGWLREMDRLPFKGIGVAPTCVTVYHRNALDAICQPEFTYLFNNDIYCEVRTPSIINHCGYPLTQLHLPYVKWNVVFNDMVPGVYHPIKTKESTRWFK